MQAAQAIRLATGLAIAWFAIAPAAALAADAPAWMRAQVGAPLPAYDEKTNAVLLYSETVLTVQPNGSIKRLQRSAYKILRPAGESYGVIRVNYDAQSRITMLHAWCIPVSGKDYEVKEKDALESAVLGVSNSELISDLRTKMLRVPAATPGSIVGYELEQEERPYMKVVEWDFQDIVPVRESRYSLQLPAGWTYKATWLNHTEELPTSSETGKWHWTLNDLKPIRIERNMPPWQGIAARMSVALVPPNGKDAGLQTWRDIGLWYLNLAQDRRDASPEIKQQVGLLTASASTRLQKMQALADFVQSNIRYVAIELGIGGFQPHRAPDVFSNRYGDCKDKATLLNVMLKEIGVESYYVIINTERGSVTATTPPNMDFNHVVLAIALPPDLEDPRLLGGMAHPKLGKLLFFDPTDTLTPFGRLSGGLQANYGVLVTAEGGELLPLPKLPIASNGISRTTEMTLDEKGNLRGDVREVWLGDLAAAQRYTLALATQETDRIKAVEAVAAASFTSFEIQKAAVGNLKVVDKPFEWHYTIEAPNYAKVAGDLLLVRPRVIGSKSSGMLETKEPREHAIEFERPERDEDIFVIAIPKGYQVDELPPAVNIDEGFATYQSKTEIVGGKLRYTRTLEIKELSVPATKAERLKHFYRIITNDERNLAVLKRVSP